MELAAYLDRIGYQGPRRADLETLKGVHRAHALAVPYENLDVQLGRPVSIDAGHCFDKVVRQRRGGWCYEQNGTLGWALEELGFKPVRFCGGGDDGAGGRTVGNHLVLRVELDGETWIADVGCGDGPLEPYRLREGPFGDRHYEYRLERMADGWWRVHNHRLGIIPYTDIHPGLTDEGLLRERCDWLQREAESVFVLNAVVLGQGADGQASVRGRLLLKNDNRGRSKRLIEDAADYVAVLKNEFGLDLPAAAGLWDRICARHDALFGSTAG